MTTFTSKPSCYGNEGVYDAGKTTCALTCQYRRPCADTISKRHAEAVREERAFGSSLGSQIRVQDVFRPTPVTPAGGLANPSPSITPSTNTALGEKQFVNQSLAVSATGSGHIAYEKDPDNPGRELMVRAVLAGSAGVLEELGRFIRGDGYRLFAKPKTVVKCTACGTFNHEKANHCSNCGKTFVL